MDNNYIEITIGNQTYYIEASRVSDLAYINNKLVNVSNSSITMVSSFDYNTTYPRITCASMSQCILRQNNSTSYTGVTQNIVMPSQFNMNTLNIQSQNNILIALLSIIIGVKLLWKR